MSERPAAAVLGLGVLGASLAMALRQTGRFASVVGWDPEYDVARRARKAGAADRYVNRPPEAVQGAAVVFLAVGLEQVKDTLTAIAPHVRPGTVVCSLDEAQERVADLAGERLPANVSFAGAHPILWDTVTAETAPAAGLFQRGVLCLAPHPDAHPDAVAYLAELAGALGMRPYFLDAREHDAFFTGIGRLPSVLAAALLRVVTRDTGWRELGRLAGGEFRHLTALADVDPAREQDALAGSREHLARWLDALVAELASLRDTLQDGREPEDFYPAAAAARRKWLDDKRTPPEVAELPDAPAAPKRRLWP